MKILEIFVKNAKKIPRESISAQKITGFALCTK